MGLKHFVTNRDQFGHPIHLNFNKKGHQHNTTFGGCLSIIIYVLLFSVILDKGIKMVFRQEDDIIQVEENTDFEEVGEMTLKKAKLIPVLKFTNLPSR
jgi:hypothetical protein